MKRRKNTSTKPSDILKDVIDTCSESGQRLSVVDVYGAENGAKYLTILAAGKTTKWKYTISIEEM